MHLWVKIWIFAIKPHRKSLIRVTHFLQIRVSWVLPISKILISFCQKFYLLDKNWTFNIVWRRGVWTIMPPITNYFSNVSFFGFIGWASPVTSPNTISTPNLPTSTPVHQAYCSSAATVSAAPRPSAGIPSETSLTSGSLLNGSSNQLAKAEEKIQGRGMSRSHASYGIQQLLQEQVLIIRVWSNPI